MSELGQPVISSALQEAIEEVKRAKADRERVQHDHEVQLERIQEVEDKAIEKLGEEALKESVDAALVQSLVQQETGEVDEPTENPEPVEQAPKKTRSTKAKPTK